MGRHSRLEDWDERSPLLAHVAPHEGRRGTRAVPVNRPDGLPGPRQQPLQLVGLVAARDHALEHVGEPRLRLDPFSFAVATRLLTIARWRAPPFEEGGIAEERG